MNLMESELTLVEQTQRQILKYIEENHGCKQLPKEQELVEILGVSRVVIREALSRLRALGIIETKRKKGTTVVAPEVFGVINTIVDSGLLDKNTLRDLYQLRIMLEVGMADFLFLNKTDEQISQLEAIVEEEHELNQKMGLTQDETEQMEISKSLTDVDIRFHSKLFEMTGNKSLIDFQYILRHLFTLYFPKPKKDFHYHNIISHIGLYNLLVSGTPDAFRMAMRLHLSTQITNMEAILDRTINK